MSKKSGGGIEKYANIHEHYNIPRAKSSNEKILAIIKKYKMLRSINEVNEKIPDLTYGAVWKAIKRLNDKHEIIVEKIIDENNRKATLVFIDEKTRDEYMNSINNTADINLTPTQLSDLLMKTNLYDLFKIIMAERMNEKTEYTDQIEKIMNDTKLRLSDGIKFTDIQKVILQIILKVMKIEFDDIVNIQENNMDPEVFVR